MLDKKYFQKVRQDLLGYASKRREVIKLSGDAQHLAKKAIFALQRDNAKEAKRYLNDSRRLIEEIYKKYHTDERVFEEGSYKAALEEYTEAVLFEQFLNNKEIGQVKEIKINPENYIAGLCDVPGEILRYAIKSATERRFDRVKECYDAAEEIIGELVDMDLTGYNRQKFDQAKQALHKLEQVVYEVSLKR